MDSWMLGRCCSCSTFAAPCGQLKYPASLSWIRTFLSFWFYALSLTKASFVTIISANFVIKQLWFTCIFIIIINFSYTSNLTLSYLKCPTSQQQLFHVIVINEALTFKNVDEFSSILLLECTRELSSVLISSKKKDRIRVPRLELSFSVFKRLH